MIRVLTEVSVGLLFEDEKLIDNVNKELTMGRIDDGEDENNNKKELEDQKTKRNLLLRIRPAASACQINQFALAHAAINGVP